MAKGQSEEFTPEFPAGGRFDVVAQHVLGIEGGYVNHAADHGGATQFGISLRFLKVEGALDANRDGFKDFDLDFDGDIDGADVRLLTKGLALNLYYHCFWRRLVLDGLPVRVDAAAFDLAVNCGAKAATKMLQRALNRLVLMAGDLKVDGDMGNQTRARARAAERHVGGVDRLLTALRQEAVAHYNAIIRADHGQVVFQAGWLKRAEGLGRV